MIETADRPNKVDELRGQLREKFPGAIPTWEAEADPDDWTKEEIAEAMGVSSNDETDAGTFPNGKVEPDAPPEQLSSHNDNSDGEQDRPRLVANAQKVKNEDGDEITVPRPMKSILQRIGQVTGGWPRRVGSALFIHEGDRIAWLENTPSAMGYLGSTSGVPPRFLKGVGYHSPSEVFAELKRTVKDYVGVEELPHHPRLPGSYYSCRWPRPGDGSTLRKLVERFAPATPIDADLIHALFVTPGWGGSGDRPAIGITSDSGRGSGKTTLAKMVGRLWGGRVEISADEPVEIVKQRLLSPEGVTKRVAVIDNMKSMRFSSAGLEALVTADVISGKRLYVGESSRPNSLLWIATLNGVSFATDWAQRSVIIKLARPAYSGNWKDETEAFIDKNRDALIGDVLGFLQRPADGDLTTFTRWGNWERDVLSRLPDPSEAQRVIAERQGESDAEGQESGDLQDAIADKLREAHFTPEEAVVFVSTDVMTDCLTAVTGERMGTTKASRIIRQRIREGGLPRLTEHRSNKSRGFMWCGEKASQASETQWDLDARLSAKQGY